MEEIIEIPPSQNYKKKKTKVIIFTIFVSLLIIGGIFSGLKYQQIQKEKKQSEYAILMAETSLDMYAEFLMSSLVVSYYSDVWDSAIDNGQDFNVALSNFRENISKDGLLEDREKGQDKLRDNMKILQNPPEEYMESYIVLKQMYGSYTKMVDQVQSPSGSLIEFNRKTNDIYSEFEKQQEEFLITLPADVKEIKKKIENDKKKDEKENKL